MAAVHSDIIVTTTSSSLPAEFGTLIQRLESFSCGRNPFSDMDKKWSTTWTNSDKYTTVFSSGYKEGEAADWALEAQAWYPDAYEVWQRMFSNKWDKADIGEHASAALKWATAGALVLNQGCVRSSRQSTIWGMLRGTPHPIRAGGEGGYACSRVACRKSRGCGKAREIG